MDDAGLAHSGIASGEQVLVLQQHRLQQILIALAVGFSVSACISLYARQWLSVGLQVVAVGALAIALVLGRRGATQRATAIMLWTLVVTLGSLILNGEGLYDEAIVAFPGILIFASMFGSRRLFLLLLCTLGLLLFVIFGLNAAHWLPIVQRQPELGRVVNLVTILCITAFLVSMLALDLRRARRQMERDHQRILASHERIEVLAHRDSLTNLPNRTLAQDRMEQLLAQAKRQQTLAAVLFLDLDNFKTVNDSLGHSAGDQLLCQVADRLTQCVRESDTVCRHGGDEFLLLLGNLADESAVTALAAKIVQQMTLPFSIGALDVVATASVGVAIFPKDGSDADTLLKNADLAMYKAKDAGRNAFRFFDATMNESVVEHLHLASGLRQALANGELQVYYQPQYQLTNGALVGAEALLRWKHPALGFIPPDRFIPVAERTGLINEIGSWVLETVCRQNKQWRDTGLGKLVIAVNVSPVQFRRDDIEREVSNALQACDLTPAALELELTESLLVGNTQHVADVVQRLNRTGIKFAIDDFGTGYSNLGYLQRFAVQRLKIDQTFVRHMCTNAHDEGIVRAVIEMAHCLKLELVAEGVEDAATLQRLQQFGCEYGQGYLWSPALPASQFEAFARQHG